jgi:MarR family transcriptional regulator for hemolysin
MGMRNGASNMKAAINRSVPAADTVQAGEPVNGLFVPQTRERAIALKLTVIARQLRQRFDQTVELDGLTRAKWRVIVAVARSSGTTQRAIAAMLEITEVTAGHLIDRLCGDGYLERREHPKDRRAYCIHLTPAAQPLLGRLEEVARINEDEAFAGFAEADLLRLDQLLDNLSRNLAASRVRHEDRKTHGGHDAATD